MSNVLSIIALIAGLIYPFAPWFYTILDEIPRDTSDPVVQFNMGVSYRFLGENDKAREHYLKALQLKSDYYEALVNIGILEIGEGNLDKAIDYLKKAIQTSGKPSLACYNLGTAYIRQNKPDEAIDALRKSLDFDPNYLKAKINLACTLSLIEDYDEAVRLFNEVLLQDPDHINTRYNLGKIYLLKLNQSKEALFQFETLLKIDPNFARRGEVETYIRQIQGGSE